MKNMRQVQSSNQSFLQPNQQMRILNHCKGQSAFLVLSSCQPVISHLMINLVYIQQTSQSVQVNIIKVSDHLLYQRHSSSFHPGSEEQATVGFWKPCRFHHLIQQVSSCLFSSLLFLLSFLLFFFFFSLSLCPFQIESKLDPVLFYKWPFVCTLNLIWQMKCRVCPHYNKSEADLTELCSAKSLGQDLAYQGPKKKSND